MAVKAASFWMDRVNADPTPAQGPRKVSLVSIDPLESRELIAARAALHARNGISQDELYAQARDRRRAALKAGRPLRLSGSALLLAAAVATCMAGSAMGNQAVLLAGFGIGLLGLTIACTLLANLLDPQVGDLAGFLQADETPATADEIAALSRASRADRELDRLIAGWWKDSGAPIRRSDLALVRNFQKAKHAA